MHHTRYAPYRESVGRHHILRYIYICLLLYIYIHVGMYTTGVAHTIAFAPADRSTRPSCVMHWLYECHAL